MNIYKFCTGAVAVIVAAMFSTAVLAVPVLQLGPGSGSDPNWHYDSATETWVYTGSTNDAALSAYALGDAFKDCSLASNGCSSNSSHP